MNNYVLYYIVQWFTIRLILFLVPVISAPTPKFLSLIHHNFLSKQLPFWRKTFVIWASEVTDFSIALKASFSSTTFSFSFLVVVFLTDVISSLLTAFLLSFSEVIFLFSSSWRWFSYLTLAHLKNDNIYVDIWIKTAISLYDFQS